MPLDPARFRDGFGVRCQALTRVVRTVAPTLFGRGVHDDCERHPQPATRKGRNRPDWSHTVGRGRVETMTPNLEIVHCDPGILGGTPVFVGTRVPVRSLFDYLEAGETLDEFVHQFPSVNRGQAIAALELARNMVLARPGTGSVPVYEKPR
jgi:uncharacterized protein (DUF433 family)